MGFAMIGETKKNGHRSIISQLKEIVVTTILDNKDLIKEKIKQKLQDEAVKLAIRKLAVSSSFGQWLVVYIVEDIFEDYAIPGINAVFRESGYQVHRVQGKLIFIRIEEAINENDLDAYYDAIDDIDSM